MSWTGIFLALGSYLLGAIPFGVLVAKSRGIDITQRGSGNIGATNVSRSLGKWAGLAVLALDLSKGLIPALLGHWLGLSTAVTLGVSVAAVVGHCFSPFLRFRGGKGVATMLGAALGSTPIVALSGLGVFAVLFGLFRIVSLASLVAIIATVGVSWLITRDLAVTGIYAAASLFVIYRHRENIRRLLKGEEPRLK